MFPHYFCIGTLVYLAVREFREWIELIVSFHDEQEPEPMPENVRHIYS